MGRKREPVAVVEAKGKTHLTKAELAARRRSEVSVPDMPFQAPPYLSDSQSAEFRWIASYLIAVNASNAGKGGGGVYSGIDSETIAQYIVCKDLSHHYQKELDAAIEAGSFDEQKDLARLHRQYCDQARAFAGDLGLTVSSRMKIVLPGSASDQDEFGGF